MSLLAVTVPDQIMARSYEFSPGIKLLTLRKIFSLRALYSGINRPGSPSISDGIWVCWGTMIVRFMGAGAGSIGKQSGTSRGEAQRESRRKDIVVPHSQWVWAVARSRQIETPLPTLLHNPSTPGVGSGTYLNLMFPWVLSQPMLAEYVMMTLVQSCLLCEH